MSVRISRHARRRMKLYGASVDEVLAVITEPEEVEIVGQRVHAVKCIAGRFSEYPLKVVYEQGEEGVLIVTAYPFKKGPGGGS